MYAEKTLVIGPDGSGPEAGLPRQGTQALHGELVRVLGVQRLALVELVPLAAQRDLLATPADQMHLDALLRRVVKRAVGELVQGEAGAKLAIGACQQVEVERRRHALRVVVGRMQHRRVLDQVGADQERAAAQHLARDLQETQRLLRREVADRRTGEKSDA